MAKITKVLGWDNRGKYALIRVLVDEQDEALVIVGGQVEIFHSDKYDRTIAWVKRPKPVENQD